MKAFIDKVQLEVDNFQREHHKAPQIVLIGLAEIQELHSYSKMMPSGTQPVRVDAIIIGPYRLIATLHDSIILPSRITE